MDDKNYSLEILWVFIKASFIACIIVFAQTTPQDIINPNLQMLGNKIGLEV